ncbi:MAG: MBOAT family protein [Lachnospiraceae bacterium]|nr:MBOAT family protein [Lachnospiraceae bacterium]
MSFTDFDFIFRFLPAFLILYYLAPAMARIYVLIVGSVFFYAMADLRFIPVLLFLSLWNYLIGKGAANGEKTVLALGVAADVISLAAARSLAAGLPGFALPLGISFYTFRMISYCFDSYRGKIPKETTFTQALAYFCLFPQILSGPIMRYGDFAKISAFTAPSETKPLKTRIADILVRVENGLTWFIFGLAAKVLLADHLRSLWNTLGGIGYESLSVPLAWLGALTYSMELYYDFWGYSMMAAGVGIMIGLPMIVNFDQPYASDSVGTFYRRWHMTLGTFFRDYVYIPLGGSRGGWLKTVRNLAFVWLLTGIWHGVNFGYLLWAASVLYMILVERALRERNSRIAAVVGRIHVLLGIPLTWVMFAVGDLERIGAYFLRLFPIVPTQGVVFAGDFAKYTSQYGIYLLFSLVFLLPCVYHCYVRFRRSVPVTVILSGLFVLSLISMARAGNNPFLYLQF